MFDGEARREGRRTFRIEKSLHVREKVVPTIGGEVSPGATKASSISLAKIEGCDSRPLDGGDDFRLPGVLRKARVAEKRRNNEDSAT